ncbi:MAG: alpha/beta hydrolase [Rhodocyclaceae bacterium]|jgi:pimeloyl-ACP methyl ester carboxylesterase|nr:alpha/beta hydrolase [Rhodocyclaceae bacterium]
MNDFSEPARQALQSGPAAEVPGWFSDAIARSGQSRRVWVDGAEIHCLTWDLDDLSKPVLLLLHGFWAHARWWDFIAPFFLDRYRIVAPDFSGMGDSPHRPHYDLATFDGDIVGVIEGLKLGRVTAIGHSFGGARLLRACADHPALFRHAIVVDSYVHFPVTDGEIPPPEPVKGSRIYPDRESAIERFRLTPPQAVTLPYLIKHIAWHSLRQTEGGWRWKFDTDIPADGSVEFDGPAILARIETPVDVVVGAESRIVSAQRAAQIMAGLKRASSLIEMPGAGHHIMLDHPLDLIDTLRTLLWQAEGEAP